MPTLVYFALVLAVGLIAAMSMMAVHGGNHISAERRDLDASLFQNQLPAGSVVYFSRVVPYHYLHTKWLLIEILFKGEPNRYYIYAHEIIFSALTYTTIIWCSVQTYRYMRRNLSLLPHRSPGGWPNS